jgi:hypothetical protein
VYSDFLTQKRKNGKNGKTGKTGKTVTNTQLTTTLSRRKGRNKDEEV